jgi:DNA modification methylase
VGELNKDQFTRFLVDTLGRAAARCRDGAIAYVFMDWRHMGELLNAGEQVFSELKNLCIWNKTNGGMGTFYRSKHELIFVFKVGTAQHVNTFGLGETGRYRTNVWEFAGVNSFRGGRLDDLELHPTVKPVDLVADAIKDCSRRGAVILDPFGGSGTTMIAAQKSGRLGRLIEYDPAYCDVILQRFEARPARPPFWRGPGRHLRTSRPRAPSPKPRMIQLKAAPRRQDLGNTCNERQG